MSDISTRLKKSLFSSKISGMKLNTRYLAIAVFFLFPFETLFAGNFPAEPGTMIAHTVSIPGIRPGNKGPMGELESVIIPLKRVGRLFLMEAKIDDLTGDFLFDTGAAQLVLNSTYFRK